MWIDLNKIPRKILFITNLIVIILFILAIILLFTEIYYIKEQGGQCMDNPVAWAERYALEEKGLNVDCSCILTLGSLNVSELNITGGMK